MKQLLLSILIIFFSLADFQAQVYNMPAATTTYTGCTGTFMIVVGLLGITPVTKIERLHFALEMVSQSI